MLNFLRSAGLVLILAASLPAAAQDKPAPAPESPAAVAPAPASPVVPTEPVAPVAPAASPFKVDRPAPDDLRLGAPPDYADGSDSLLGSLLRMVLVLGLVLALVYVSLNWGLRKLMRVDPVRNAAVKVHERIPLEAKKTVYLVEAGEEFMLLGVGESEVSFLTRLDAERMRAVLARRSEAPKPLLAGRPFWERLLVKPPPKGETPKGGGGKDPSGAQGGPAPT